MEQIRRSKWVLLVVVLCISKMGFCLDPESMKIYPSWEWHITPPSQNAYLCAKSSLKVSVSPGNNSEVIGYIFFGEEVMPAGNATFRNGTSFIEIRTTDNRSGWVEESALVKDGGLIVFTASGNIYPSPDFNTPLYQTSFQQGDMAILVDFQDEWMRLIGSTEGKEGWVNGLDKVSIDPADISIGKLLLEAERERDPVRKRQLLEGIRNFPNFFSSPLAITVDQKINSSSGTPSFPSTSSSLPSTSYLSNEGMDFTAAFDRSVPNTAASQYFVETITDPVSNRTFQRVTEIGSYQPVKGPANPKSIYFAYHKTREIGTYILLETPSGGYTRLMIVNKLKSDNSNVVGLGEAVLRESFGPNYKDVKQIKIVYPLD